MRKSSVVYAQKINFFTKCLAWVNTSQKKTWNKKEMSGESYLEKVAAEFSPRINAYIMNKAGSIF